MYNLSQPVGFITLMGVFIRFCRWYHYSYLFDKCKGVHTDNMDISTKISVKNIGFSFDRVNMP